MSAPSALHEEGKDGNEFIPFKSFSAAHAVRGAGYDALLPRYPEYTYIQEGTDTKAKGNCEDEDYDYGKLQRYSRKLFWSKHTKLSESEVEESRFMPIVLDGQQTAGVPSDSQESTEQNPVADGQPTSQRNEISFIKVRFRDGLTLQMSNVSVVRMVSLLQNVHC